MDNDDEMNNREAEERQAQNADQFWIQRVQLTINRLLADPNVRPGLRRRDVLEQIFGLVPPPEVLPLAQEGEVIPVDPDDQLVIAQLMGLVAPDALLNIEHGRPPVAGHAAGLQAVPDLPEVPYPRRCSPTRRVLQDERPPGPSQAPRISDIDCEKATFLWHLHEKTYPAPIVPQEEILNPASEPERDVSKSILDLFESVDSGVFVRGQEVNNPTEWRLQLTEVPGLDEDAPKNTHLVLTCVRCYIPENRLLIKTSLEIIDKDGNVISDDGDVFEAQLKVTKPGETHSVNLGTKQDLQSKIEQILSDGGLRFRLRLNIYKELPPLPNVANLEEDEEDVPAKKKLRRMMDGGNNAASTFALTLENLWKNRDRSGDITIRCNKSAGGHTDIKVHKLILSARSDVFSEMFDSPMGNIEKEKGIVEINDISEEIMLSLMEYLYLGDISRFDWTNVDDLECLIYASDKYMIQPLLIKCFQHLIKEMTLENFGRVVKATFTFNSEKEFKDQVRHFYESKQVTLNRVQSFRTFATENFDEFYKLFFYKLE